MRKVLRYAMILSLVFLCGSGLSLSRTESFLHEYFGMGMLICVIIHLAMNCRWFSGLFKNKYRTSRILITVIDLMLIIAVFLIMTSSLTISGYIFSFLKLKGTLWGRRIHLVMTAWLFVLCGIHYGMHLKTGKRNPFLYALAICGAVSFVICRFYERLFLINEFVYMPSVPEPIFYLMHIPMFISFICIGNEIKSGTITKREKL